MIAKNIFLLYLLAAYPVYGQLAWQSQMVEVHPSLNDKVGIARFSFKNSGSGTITISDIKTSCGCTTADSEKRSYGPGETGDVTAIFSEYEKGSVRMKRGQSAHCIKIFHLPKILSS